MKKAIANTLSKKLAQVSAVGILKEWLGKPQPVKK
jgi:hypothetical protein